MLTVVFLQCVHIAHMGLVPCDEHRANVEVCVMLVILCIII